MDRVELRAGLTAGNHGKPAGHLAERCLDGRNVGCHHDQDGLILVGAEDHRGDRR
jgi:hypothetical protein